MTSDRDRLRVELDVNPASAVHRASAPASASTFRIALLGDFSGRESHGETTVEHGRAIAARRPVRVDRDTLDDVIARFRPRVRWSDVSERAMDIELTSLEDFHPDRLYDRLPIFRALRDARDRAAAVAVEPSARSPSAAGASVLEAMLGEVPTPPTGARLAPATAEQTATRYDAGSLPDLVRRVVAPHLIADTGEASPRVVDIDAAIVSTLRLLLHSPDFQRLEALWRGVDFLVRRLDTDERLQIHLIDIAPSELRLDLAGDRARSGLFRLLVEDTVGTPGAAPWSLLVGCYTLGADAGDMALLKGLASVARASGAPLVVGGHPLLAGCRSFATSPDPEDWTESEPDGWRALRESLDALCLAVVLPRFLLRLPYGARTDPCELLRFEEGTGEGLLEHECYLWGNGALTAALLLGDVLARGDAGPHAMRIGGLPLHVVRAGGDVLAKPCSEVLLGERDAERLLDRGVTPLMWVKDSDEVVLPRVQSIAAPLAPLAFERRASGAPKPVHG